MSADITISHLGMYINSPNFCIVMNERDSNPQGVSIDDVIKSTYDACLEFVDKNYGGANSNNQKSGKAKLVELLKNQFPGEPKKVLNEKVGRIKGALKRSKDFKIEDLEKMLVDGKEDDIEFVKAKIQEAQKMLDDKNVKSKIMTEDAASADV